MIFLSLSVGDPLLQRLQHATPPGRFQVAGFKDTRPRQKRGKNGAFLWLSQQNDSCRPFEPLKIENLIEQQKCQKLTLDLTARQAALNSLYLAGVRGRCICNCIDERKPSYCWGLALKKHWELANARTWFPEEMWHLWARSWPVLACNQLKEAIEHSRMEWDKVW